MSAVADVLAADVPVLVDADGLRLLDASVVRARTAPTLLTPHAGEAAALLGVPREEVEAGRLAAVRELAARYGATVLLKGSTTLVADRHRARARTGQPDRHLLAGHGGQRRRPVRADGLPAGRGPRARATPPPWCAYLHGLAARLASDGGPVAAQDVADAIPAAWRDVRA